MQLNIEKLSLAQARAGLSAKDIQREASISNVTLSRIRNGRQTPRPQTIGRLAKALGVDPSEIIESDTR